MQDRKKVYGGTYWKDSGYLRKGLSEILICKETRAQVEE
jgi:hypothetical protein